MMKVKLILFIIIFFCMFQLVSAAPVLDPIPTPQNLTEGTLFTYDVDATGGTGTLYFSDDTDNFDIDTSTGVISFTPTNAMVGSFVAVIIVRDDLNEIDAQAVNFTVNGVPILDALVDQNVAFGDELFYDIDATDPEDGSNVVFSDNSSLFDINSSTGIINFTTNITGLGIYSINISVNDSENAQDSDTFQLAINDQPNITGLPLSNATEDVLFTINMSLYVNDSVGTLTFSDNTTMFIIDSATGIINFTPNGTHLGDFQINISVQDNYGLSDYANWTLNITAVNDAPTFPSISNQTTSTGRTFIFDINATDEENDTIFYYDNSSFFDINLSTGLINFSVNSTMLGTNSINITVNDSSDASYSDIFILQINENSAPFFPKNMTLSINSNFDTYVDSQFPTTSYQGSEFLRVADVSGSIKRSYINFSLGSVPNSSNILIAKLNLTINTALGGTNLSTFRINNNWSGVGVTYNNQPEINSTLTSNLSSGSTLDSFNVTNIVRSWYNGSFVNHGFSLRTEDETGDTGTIIYYSADSADSSRWPLLDITYNTTIPDQSFSATSNITNSFNLDDYFYDANDDTLTYNVTSTILVNITIDDNNNVSIFPVGTAAATVDVTFSASDEVNVTESNVVTITVTASEGGDDGDDSGSSGGGSSRTTSIASLNIIFDPDRQTITEGDLIQVPVILENSGEVNLQNIDLSLNSDLSGLIMELSETFIDGLNIDETSDLILTIDSKDAIGETYIINLYANSASPTLNESAIFVLDVLSEGEGTKEELILAKDMFRNNPECMELQELLDKAELQLDQKLYDEARRNVALAIESCKNLVRMGDEERGLSTGIPLLTKVLIFLSILTVFIIVLYTVFIKMKFQKKN